MKDPDWEVLIDAVGEFLDGLMETQRGTAFFVLMVVALGVGLYLLWV